MSDTFTQQIRVAGVSHLTVVSGLHLGIVCGSFYLVLRKLHVCTKATSMITAVSVLFIMALCGFGVSIVRSAIVYLILLFGNIIGRKPDPLNSLGAGVCLITAVSPFAVGSVSFLLSVSATAGLLVLSPKLSLLIGGNSIRNQFLRGVVCFIRDSVSISISTFLATLPVIIYYFEAVSLWSVFSNLLLSYAVTLVLILAVLGILFSFLDSVASVLLAAAGLVGKYCVSVIRMIGSLEMGCVTVPSELCLAAAGGTLFFAVVLFLLCEQKKQYRKKKKGGADDNGAIRRS